MLRLLSTPNNDNNGAATGGDAGPVVGHCTEIGRISYRSKH